MKLFVTIGKTQYKNRVKSTIKPPKQQAKLSNCESSWLFSS